MTEKRVHLSPRLSCALEMLQNTECVADIGCDHGRLAAALLQTNCCKRVIASDISAASLQKAQALIEHIGLAERVSFRCGDGLNILENGECDAIAILGMGGTLMASLLADSERPLKDARILILQPMRAQDDIRSYLYEKCFWITDDRIVYERQRYYQILKAELHSQRQPWPKAFPQNFFDVGYQSFVQNDPNLCALCQRQLNEHRKQILTAKGTPGEQKLSSKIDALEQILHNFRKKS